MNYAVQATIQITSPAQNCYVALVGRIKADDTLTDSYKAEHLPYHVLLSASQQAEHCPNGADQKFSNIGHGSCFEIWLPLLTGPTTSEDQEYLQ